MKKSQKKRGAGSKRGLVKGNNGTQNIRAVEGLVNPALVLNAPNAKQSYIDSRYSVTVGTTTGSGYRLLEPLMGPSGLLITYPQLCRVAAGGSIATPKWFKSIMVTGIEYQLNLVGAQSNTLIAADLYNRVRIVIWDTKFSFSASVIAQWDIDGLTDWTRASKLLLDQTVGLGAQAFDSANYNVPGTSNLRGFIPYRHRFDIKSTTTVGGLPTVLDTDEDNLLFGIVSDSALVPHPSMTGTIRVHYIELDQ